MADAFRIRLRNGLRNEWLERNPILSEGEVAIEFQEDSDRVKIKVGNGSLTYNELPYFNDPISYKDLSNKPMLNGFELDGNRNLMDYGIQPLGSYITLETALQYLEAKADKDDTYSSKEIDDLFYSMIKLPEIGNNRNKYLKIDASGVLYWAELNDDFYTRDEIDDALSQKVTKQDGYSLMSSSDKAKLDNLHNYDDQFVEVQDKIDEIWKDLENKSYTTDIIKDYYNKDEVDDLLDDKANRSELASKADADLLASHITNINNPHKVTAKQLGLENVDNTSDMDKPISTATQEALDNKQDSMKIGFGLALENGELRNTNPNVNADWEAYSGDAYILNKPSLSKVATSNDYNDLDNLPFIPEEYELPDATEDELGGIKLGPNMEVDDEGHLIINYPDILFDYNLLTNKPSIWGTDENGVEQLYELTQGMTKADLDIMGHDEAYSMFNEKADKSNTYTKTEVNNLIDNTILGNISWDKISGNPNDNPTLKYQLSEKANVNDLHRVAFSGDYNDLSNTPKLLSDFVNDANYATKTEVNNAISNIDNTTTIIENSVKNIENTIKTNDSKVVHLSGTETITGNKTFSGVATFTQTIQGTALKALWGDLAEYNAGDAIYPYGTLVQFGGDYEFTIAKDEVNAVVADLNTVALLINGGNTFKYPLPIVLTGRVKVKVEGNVKKFDKLYLSTLTPGVASNIPNGEHFGRALTDNANGYVLANVFARF